MQDQKANKMEITKLRDMFGVIKYDNIVMLSVLTFYKQH